ncbi:MAG: Hsp20/alpha crystallin family protein [bacterium]
MTDTKVQKKEKKDVDEVERTRSGKCFLPPTDIIDKQDNIVVLADMPGVDQKSIDITLENNILTIQGCVNEKQPEDYTLVHSEYQVGDYYRSFTLSDTINQEGIKATYKNGVLQLDLPKAEKAKSRKIEIQS